LVDYGIATQNSGGIDGRAAEIRHEIGEGSPKAQWKRQDSMAKQKNVLAGS
jgi:hypothetical protein